MFEHYINNPSFFNLMPVFLGACIVLAIGKTLVSISRVMKKRRVD